MQSRCPLWLMTWMADVQLHAMICPWDSRTDREGLSGHTWSDVFLFYPPPRFQRYPTCIRHGSRFPQYTSARCTGVCYDHRILSSASVSRAYWIVRLSRDLNSRLSSQRECRHFGDCRKSTTPTIRRTWSPSRAVWSRDRARASSRSRDLSKGVHPCWWRRVSRIHGTACSACLRPHPGGWREWWCPRSRWPKVGQGEQRSGDRSRVRWARGFFSPGS